MKSKVVATALLFLATMSLPISEGCTAPSIAELLPPDSLGYVEISDMGVLYYLVGEVGGTIVKSLEEEAEIPEHIRVKARAVLEAFNEIKPLLPKSASLGVVSLGPEAGPSPSLFVSELPEGLATLVSAGISIGALFIIGVVKTLFTGLSWLRSGLEMVAIGVFATVATYLIGGLFDVGV